MIRERFDVSCGAQVNQFFGDGGADLFACLRIDLSELLQCFGLPIDRVHTWIISYQYVLKNTARGWLSRSSIDQYAIGSASAFDSACGNAPGPTAGCTSCANVNEWLGSYLVFTANRPACASAQ